MKSDRRDPGETARITKWSLQKELQKLKNKSYNLEWSEANPADLETGFKTLAAIDADTAGNGPPKGPKSDALYKAPMVICNLNTHSSPFQR